MEEERGEDDAMALVTMNRHAWPSVIVNMVITWLDNRGCIQCMQTLYECECIDFLFAFLFAFEASPALFDKISLSRHFMRDAANKWPQTERCEKCSLCVCGNFAIVIMDSNTYSNKCLYVCNSSPYFRIVTLDCIIIARDQDLKPSQHISQWSALSEYYDSNWDKTHAELLPNTLKHANAYYHLCTTCSETYEE